MKQLHKLSIDLSMNARGPLTKDAQCDDGSSIIVLKGQVKERARAHAICASSSDVRRW